MSSSAEASNDVETAGGGRPKFKKRAKKPPKAHLRSRYDDDEDTNDDSAMQTIEQTKKKRKLLNEALYKKGLDVTLTAEKIPQTDTSAPSTKETNGDLSQRLEGAFAGEGGDANAEGGVLMRKHQTAMEAFVKQRLSTQEVDPTEKETPSTDNLPRKTATDDLFAELASASQRLAGTDKAAAEPDKEGDVGAGGAMLGGTGIAEVTLPADDRIQTIRETNEAVSSIESSTACNKRSSAVPQGTNDSIVPGNDSISHVPSSYSHNFQLHTQEWIKEQKRQEQQVQPTASGTTIEQQKEERMGFDAARRVARGDNTGATNSPSNEDKKRSGDDRAWKNFMTKQQQSRS